MDADTRAVLAHVIAKYIMQKQTSALFDQGRNTDIRFVGSVEPGAIDVRSVGKGPQLTSRSTGNELLLFQATDDYHIDVTIEEEEFEGFDEKSECHFEGRFEEPVLWFFDYEDAKHHRYVF